MESSLSACTKMELICEEKMSKESIKGTPDHESSRGEDTSEEVSSMETERLEDNKKAEQIKLNSDILQTESNLRKYLKQIIYNIVLQETTTKQEYLAMITNEETESYKWKIQILFSRLRLILNQFVRLAMEYIAKIFLRDVNVLAEGSEENNSEHENF